MRKSSFLKMSRSNSQFLGASVNEFINIWVLGGDASLNLTTSGGLTKVAFNCTLGPPDAPYSFPPSSGPCPPPWTSPPHTPTPNRPRHRGPSQRERNRQRAARHQAAQVEAAASVSSSVSAPVNASMTAPAPAPPLVPASAPAPVPEPVSPPGPTQGPAQVSVSVSQATSTTMTSVMAPVAVSVISSSIPTQKSSFATINSVNLNAATASSPVTSTPTYVPGMEFSSSKHDCPANAPPPPPCKKCGKFTTWGGSRVKTDLAWLHFYMCSGSSMIEGFPSCNIQTCLVTPPLPNIVIM